MKSLYEEKLKELSAQEMWLSQRKEALADLQLLINNIQFELRPAIEESTSLTWDIYLANHKPCMYIHLYYSEKDETWLMENIFNPMRELLEPKELTESFQRRIIGDTIYYELDFEDDVFRKRFSFEAGVIDSPDCDLIPYTETITRYKLKCGEEGPSE